ncbi:hypothetical protein D6C76_04450 [Aureobasidium pullulans]|nr:hypothetical protein D6C76_04450 [Aureobasidium pullulans]
MGQQQSQPGALRRDATGNSTLRLSRRTRLLSKPQNVLVRRPRSEQAGLSSASHDESHNSIRTPHATMSRFLQHQSDAFLHDPVLPPPRHTHANDKHTNPSGSWMRPVSVIDAASIAACVAHRNLTTRKTTLPQNSKPINNAAGPIRTSQEPIRVEQPGVGSQPRTTARDSLISNPKVTKHVPGAFPILEESTTDNPRHTMNVTELEMLPGTRLPSVKSEERVPLFVEQVLVPGITALQNVSNSLDTKNMPRSRGSFAGHKDQVANPYSRWRGRKKKPPQNRKQMTAEAQPQTRECVVCCESLDPLTFPARPPSSECTHRPEVCPPCLQRWVATKVAANDRGRIYCPQCVILLNHNDVRRACDHTTFAEYDKHAVLNVVSRMVNFNWCLRAGCDGGQEQDGKTLGYMKCHSCDYAQCLHHRMRWHTGETCKQYDERTNNRHNEKTEEMINNSLLTAYLQKCPRCQVVCEKNGGCRQMICTRCGWRFTWEKARKLPKVKKPVGPRPMRSTLRVEPPTGLRARIARFLSP